MSSVWRGYPCLEQYENLEASHEEHRGCAEGRQRKSPGSLSEQGPRVRPSIDLDLLVLLSRRHFEHRNRPVRCWNADDTRYTGQTVLVHRYVARYQEEFSRQLVVLRGLSSYRRSSGWTKPARCGPRQDNRAQSHRVIRTSVVISVWLCMAPSFCSVTGTCTVSCVSASLCARLPFLRRMAHL